MSNLPPGFSSFSDPRGRDLGIANSDYGGIGKKYTPPSKPITLEEKKKLKAIQDDQMGVDREDDL